MFVRCLFSSPNSRWPVLIVCSSIETNTSSGITWLFAGARPSLRPIPVRGYISTVRLILWTFLLGRSPEPGRGPSLYKGCVIKNLQKYSTCKLLVKTFENFQCPWGVVNHCSKPNRYRDMYLLRWLISEELGRKSVSHHISEKLKFTVLYQDIDFW